MKFKYFQHLSSQKHSDKVNNSKSMKKKRFVPYWKKGNNTRTSSSRKPLVNNFISGGYENY